MERKVLKGKYLFVNQFKSSNYGFIHISTLFKGEKKIGQANCHYENRTWESYEYQTSMKRVINDLISSLQEQTLKNYKRDNGISRFKKGQKQEILDNLEKNTQMKEYRKIYKELDVWA